MEEKSGKRGVFLRLVMVWLGIILLTSFCLTMKASNDPVSITAMPEAPRKGDPIVVTFRLNNPYPVDLVSSYRFYADGKLLKEGSTSLATHSSKTYKYIYPSPVGIGDQVNFAIRSSLVGGGTGGVYEKTASVPPFPPQVASSFISFASFSTTVMSSMSSMSYYNSNFAAPDSFNTGLVITICLILLLIFLELAGATKEEKGGGATGGLLVLNRFKMGLGTLTWILFVVFIGIVYTKIVLILSVP